MGWAWLGIAAAGLAFLVVGWRMLPQDRKGAASIDAAFNLKAYTTEAVVPDESPLVGRTVKDLEDAGEGEVEVIVLLRLGRRRHAPAGNVILAAGDILILQGDPEALERVVGLEKLKLARDKKKDYDTDTPRDDIGVMEAVITADSELDGVTPVQSRLHERFAVDLLAVSRSGTRNTQRLRAMRL